MLADQSRDMSERGRRDLADALHAAADAAENDDRELAEALRRAGVALESPNRDLAAPGVEQLASELGALAGRGAAEGAGELAPRMESRPGPMAERLSVTPLSAVVDEADGGGAVVGNASSSDRAEAGAAPPVAGRAPSATETSSGSDPLDYPWSMRDALRQYFARHGARR